MKTQEVDKKLDLLRTQNNEVELEFYNIPNPKFDLYGVFYDKNEGFLRLPMDVAKTVSEGVTYLANHTTGGRVKFSTDSNVIEIKVKYSDLQAIPHMSLVGQAGFVLLEERKKDRKYIRILPPQDTTCETGFTANTQLEGGEMRNYILYFPLYNPVKELQIGLQKGSKVENGKPYKNLKPILYYGSSITQGACASRPDNDYQAFIEKWNDIDFINLGFSGNGKGEETMANYLANIECSLFVNDFNNSGIDLDYMKVAHKRLYEIFRKKQPTTPIIFLTKTNLWEGTDHKERVKLVKQTYEYALAKGDKNVYFVDGASMFKGKDKMSFAVDGDHPTDLGFYHMAKEIYKQMKKIDKKFW